MTRAEIIARVQFYAQMYGINPAIGVEQIRTESNFNPRARSEANAEGLGQFIPETWARYGKGRDPYDVEANLDAWGRLMRDLLKQFNGDYARALIAYHSGPGAVEGVLRNPAGNPRSTAYYKGILERAGTAITSASNLAALAGNVNSTPPPNSSNKFFIAFAALALLALATR